MNKRGDNIQRDELNTIVILKYYIYILKEERLKDIKFKNRQTYKLKYFKRKKE